MKPIVTDAIEVESLVTSEYPLSDVDETRERYSNDESQVKVALDPGGSMRRTRVAVVGPGRIAHSRIDGIRQWPDRSELGAVVDVDDDRPHNFAYQMREFVDPIDAGRDPNSSGEEILTRLSLIAAAERSATEDRLVGV